MKHTIILLNVTIERHKRVILHDKQALEDDRETGRLGLCIRLGERIKTMTAELADYEETLSILEEVSCK